MNIEVKLTVPELTNWEGQYTPIPYRDKRGRIQWNLLNNTPEENEKKGIWNVQALFLDKFPDFNIQFPRTDNDMIAPHQREKAQEFILEKIGSHGKFRSVIGQSTIKKEIVPYFEGNFRIALIKSFKSWGIELNLGLPPPEGWMMQSPLAKQLEIARGSVKGVADKYKSEHPEWVEEYLDSTGQQREHYSPELVSLIIQESTRHQPSDGNLPSATDLKKMNRDLSADAHLELGNLDDNFIADQKMGLNLLGHFLQGNIPFSKLPKFVLDINHEKLINKRNLHFRSATRLGVEIFITIPKDRLSRPPNRLKVIPRMEDTKGANPYYWIDLFEETDNGDGSFPMFSGRLLPEEARLDFKSWHNLGEQLLVDFLWKNNGITFTDLIPFNIRMGKKGSPYFIAAREELPIVALHGDVEDNEILRFIPRSHLDKYFWIDLFKTQINTPDSELLQVGSYRLFPETRQLRGRKAYTDIERVLLLDYIQGNNDLKFTDLKPIHIVYKKQENNSILIIRNKGVDLTINPSRNLPDGSPVVLIPKQDDHEIYQWLELYQYDPNNHQIIGSCLASARIVKGSGLAQRGWYGPEREYFRDYLEGKIPSEYLTAIPLIVGDSQTIWLNSASQYPHLETSYGKDGKGIYLSLPQMGINLSKGDNLLLVPENKENNFIFFSLRFGNQDLGLYKFDIDKETFEMITKKRDKEPNQLKNIIPPEEADEYFRKLMEGYTE